MEEISIRICQNIVKKMNFKNGYRAITADNLFCILRFIMLYEFDGQTQQQMLNTFFSGSKMLINIRNHYLLDDGFTICKVILIKIPFHSN